MWAVATVGTSPNQRYTTLATTVNKRCSVLVTVEATILQCERIDIAFLVVKSCMPYREPIHSSANAGTVCKRARTNERVGVAPDGT